MQDEGAEDSRATQYLRGPHCHPLAPLYFCLGCSYKWPPPKKDAVSMGHEIPVKRLCSGHGQLLQGFVVIFPRYTVENKKIEILYVSGQHYQQLHFLSAREARIPGMKEGKDCPVGLARILNLPPLQWSHTAGKRRWFAGKLIFLA